MFFLQRLLRCGLPADDAMAQHEKRLRELAEKGLTEQQQQLQGQEQQEGKSPSDASSSEDEGMDVA